LTPQGREPIECVAGRTEARQTLEGQYDTREAPLKVLNRHVASAARWIVQKDAAALYAFNDDEVIKAQCAMSGKAKRFESIRSQR